MKSLKKIKIILLLIGLVGFATLLYKLDAREVYYDLCQLKWRLFLVLLPYSLVFALDTLGWKYAFQGWTPKLTFSSLFAARMAGEAINCLTPSGYMGGEPLKAYLLKRYNISMVEGMASVVISRTIMAIAQVVFILLGVTLALSRFQATGMLLTVATGTILVGIPITALVFISQKKGLFTAFYNLLRRFKITVRYLEDRERELMELDENISQFYSTNRRGFFLCFFFYFLGWLAGVIEVYLILTFLGVPIDLFGLFIIESLFTVARSVTSFIPGSLGGQEGGVVLIFLALQLTIQTGLSFCIIRRIREAVWVLAGLLILARWKAEAVA
jgi:putative membrane protein